MGDGCRTVFPNIQGPVVSSNCVCFASSSNSSATLVELDERLAGSYYFLVRHPRPKDPYRTTTAVHSRSASIPISRLRCTSSPVYWLGRHFHCHLPDVSLQGVFEAAFRPCERPVPRPTRIQHISYTRMQSSLSPLVPKTAHSSHQGSGKHSR